MCSMILRRYQYGGDDYVGGDSPLMHQDDLRFPADLRMDAHGKDERIILSVCEVELLHP